MSEAHASLASRFDALSRRERAIILLAGALAIGLIAWFYVIDPQRAKEQRATQGLLAVRVSLAQLHSQSSELTHMLAQDVNAQPHARIAVLEQKVAELDNRLRTLQRGLVPPQKMAATLEDMLDRNQRLKLLSLRTLAAGPLIEDPKPVADPQAKTPGATPKLADAASASKTTEPAQRIFKHGVELTLQGSYQDLLAYMAQLEHLPVQMFWAESGMDAKDYPRVKLKLTLFTLSLDETWLVL